MLVCQLSPIEIVKLSWQRQRQTSRSRKFMARSLILPTLPILNITALMSKGGIGSQRPSTSVKQQLVNQHTEDDENDVTEDDDVIRKASEQMLNCSEVNSTDWSETTGINEEFGLLRRRQSRGIKCNFRFLFQTCLPVIAAVLACIGMYFDCTTTRCET